MMRSDDVIPDCCLAVWCTTLQAILDLTMQKPNVSVLKPTDGSSCRRLKLATSFLKFREQKSEMMAKFHSEAMSCSHDVS